MLAHPPFGIAVEVKLLGGATGSAFFFQCSLRRGQSRSQYPEGRAGDVVEPHAMAELYRLRISAMFAADSDLELGTGLAAF